MRPFVSVRYHRIKIQNFNLSSLIVITLYELILTVAQEERRGRRKQGGEEGVLVERTPHGLHRIWRTPVSGATFARHSAYREFM